MFLSHLANSTVVIMNLVIGTKYSGISPILATNHKNIIISEMTLSCSKLMRLNEIRNFRKVEIIIEDIFSILHCMWLLICHLLINSTLLFFFWNYNKFDHMLNLAVMASALRSVSIWAHRESSVWPGCLRRDVKAQGGNAAGKRPVFMIRC
jgi:hypothetical protein